MAATPGGTALTAAAQDSVRHTSRHLMPFGAEFQPGGSVRFSLWAPNHERIAIELNDAPAAVPMRREGDGWHRLMTDRAGPGSRYRFILPDGFAVPDPASRYQPADVHGPSEVVAHEVYAWRDHE